ncbi:MAG TPA: hypothetical protein VLL95_16260, partial [Phnomibacter sp.]|nr:hypothetical protein [Phnomibacter sp.]
SVKVEIVNEQGRTVRKLNLMASKGMNRFYWDLTNDGLRMPVQPKPKSEVQAPPGAYVIAGNYKVRIKYGSEADSAMVKVNNDPRKQVDAAGVAVWQAGYEEFTSTVNGVTASMDKLRDAKDQMNAVEKMVSAQVKDTAAKKRFADAHKLASKQVDSLMRLVAPGEEIQGIYEDPSQLMNKLMGAAFYLDPAFGTPNPPASAPPATFGWSMKKLKADAGAFNEAVKAFENKTWKQFEEVVKGLNLQLLPPLGQ